DSTGERRSRPGTNPGDRPVGSLRHLTRCQSTPAYSTRPEGTTMNTPDPAALAETVVALRDNALADLRRDVTALMHDYAGLDPDHLAVDPAGEPVSADAALDAARDRLAELHRILMLADAAAGELMRYSSRLTSNNA